MKKIIFTTIIMIATWQFTMAQESYTKDISQLPGNARDFIDQHFSNEAISYILIDKEIVSTEYEVVLANGQEIKFDKNGDWKEIDGKRKAIPGSVIPNEVGSYLQANFPGTSIEQIERKFWGWEVELMNGLELKLDKKGKLLKMDD